MVDDYKGCFEWIKTNKIHCFFMLLSWKCLFDEPYRPNFWYITSAISRTKKWQNWKVLLLGQRALIFIIFAKEHTFKKDSFYEMVVNNFVYSRTWKAFKNNCDPINQIVCGLFHEPLVKCLLLYMPLSPPELCDVSRHLYTVFMSLCQESCVF